MLTLKQKLPGRAGDRAPARGEVHRADAGGAGRGAARGVAWLYEIKFDGYRALGVKTRGEVELLSRNHLKLNARFPKIAAALEALDDGTILDGEVVAVDAQGRPRFNALQNSQRSSQPIFYYVFDCLELRGQSLLHLPLRERRRMLEELPLADPVRISQTLDGEAGRAGPGGARAGAGGAGGETGQQHLRAGRAQRRVGKV